MEDIFNSQEDKDGVVSDGYSALKELTGLGISSDDVENIVAKQKETIEGLQSAIDGKSDMNFEEAYKHYMGVDFSTEKIDNYMKLSNTYSTIMTASQYDSDYIEKFEEETGTTIDKVAKEYYLSQTEALGKDTVMSKLVDKYAEDQENFADKLSTAITATGFVCMATGAVLCVTGVGAGPGAALMASGKYISLGGMFIDNAMDLADDATDKDGLTKEEAKDFAIETGVEAVSYAAGRGIGKLTNGLNTAVTNKAVEMGAGKAGSYIAGQTAETLTDATLSLGADFAIAEGESYLTNGEFIQADNYFSKERIMGEGKNQIMGIVTGLASSKVNSYNAKNANIDTTKPTAETVIKNDYTSQKYQFMDEVANDTDFQKITSKNISDYGASIESAISGSDIDFDDIKIDDNGAKNFYKNGTCIRTVKFEHGDSNTPYSIIDNLGYDQASNSNIRVERCYDNGEFYGIEMNYLENKYNLSQKSVTFSIGQDGSIEKGTTIENQNMVFKKSVDEMHAKMTQNSILEAPDENTKLPEYLYHVTTKENYESMLSQGKISMGKSSDIPGTYCIDAKNFESQWGENEAWENNLKEDLIFNQVARKKGSNNLVVLKIPTEQINDSNIKVRTEEDYFNANKVLHSGSLKGIEEPDCVKNGYDWATGVKNFETNKSLEFIIGEDIDISTVDVVYSGDVSQGADKLIESIIKH